MRESERTEESEMHFWHAIVLGKLYGTNTESESFVDWNDRQPAARQ